MISFSGFLRSWPPHALNGFATGCDMAGIKINSFKTEVLHFFRNSVQWTLQVGGLSLKQVKKFKYLWVAFTNDGRQDEKLNVRSSKATWSCCPFNPLEKEVVDTCKTVWEADLN